MNIKDKIRFEFPFGLSSSDDERRYIILEVVDLSMGQSQRVDSILNSQQKAYTSTKDYVFGKSEKKEKKTTNNSDEQNDKDENQEPNLISGTTKRMGQTVVGMDKPVFNIKESYQDMRQHKKHQGQTKLQIALPFPDTFTESQEQEWSTSKGILGSVAGNLMDKNLPILGMNQSKFVGQVQAHQGTRKPIPNPGYFQDYEGPKPRQFQLTWTLMPNSRQDMETLQTIIYNLKKFTSPSSQLSDTILLQPYSFNITLMNDIISPVQGLDLMVCSNISVDWGTKQNLYPDGQPKVVVLSMQFTERKTLLMGDY